jgi:hypothetical protein
MAAAPDLGSGAARRGGSSPFIRTVKVIDLFGGFIIYGRREEKFIPRLRREVPSSAQLK